MSETVNQPSEAPTVHHRVVDAVTGISRGANTQPKLILPPNASVARLHIGIEPEEDYKSFGVDLRTAGGRPLDARWSNSPAHVAGDRYGLRFPQALSCQVVRTQIERLPETGSPEDIGFYYFQVMKR